MHDTRRDQFLKRISTVGAGTRETIQMLLGGIVNDLREHIVNGLYLDNEMDVVVAFHDATEELWRMTLSTRPPLAPDVLLARLRRLHGLCIGPLMGFRERVVRAVEKAESLEVAKKSRERQADE